MPVYKSRTVLKVARGVKAFLSLEAGVTHSAIPGSGRSGTEERKLERLWRRGLTEKDGQLAGSRAKPEGWDGAGAENDGLRPENVVWIFGFGRSGSTWLTSMMGKLEGHVVWREPLVGALFGNFYYSMTDAQRENKSFILGPRQEAWLGLIRSFFLDGARTRFRRLSSEEVLVVKESNGSVGAPLLMQALPESRMVLLIRDPRDIMASVSDAVSKGSWGPSRLGVEDLPDFDTSWWTERYLQNVGNAKRAYEAHQGHKALVKYEELRADPLGTMKRLYVALGIPVNEEALIRVVHKCAWENIPEEKKGQAKFYRKATPGGWKEDLTAEQVETIERIAAPLLEEFYS